MRKPYKATQLQRVKMYMADEGWHTLREIAMVTGAPEQSVSARLRDLRKASYGGHVVQRQECLRPSAWLMFEYRVTLCPKRPYEAQREMDL